MNIAIIPVPYSLDEPDVGMGRAPEALLEAGLAGRLEAVGCTVEVCDPVRVPASDDGREARLGRLLGLLSSTVARVRLRGAFPLVLGGDCMTALGTLGGLLDPSDTGVVWLDAHGDFNTPETTISGYLGGMCLACAAGRGLEKLRAAAGLAEPVPEGNIVLVGARDLDPQEAEALAGSGVALVRGEELGAGAKALGPALDTLGGLSQVYLHLDIDVLDPAGAPGVDYPAAGGLSQETLHAVVRQIAGVGNLAALALTAVNPERDPDGRTVQAAIAAAEVTLAEAVSVQL